MTATAITMMVLFMIVIWGGLAASVFHLSRHHDETSGFLGEQEHLTSEKLLEHERH